MKIAASIRSNFSTIDIAQKEDGAWLIMELGLSPKKSPTFFFPSAGNMELRRNYNIG
jgi:hypothetical protein